jgi:RNA polymerase sigma-70 factor, ECF subfamily
MDLLWFSLVGAVSTGQDQNLLLRLKSRDPQAIAELYTQYGRIVFAVILRIVNNTGIAEDLVQETYLRAWNRAAGLDEDYGSVGPWLLSIARNCALDYRKSAQARMSAQTSVDEVCFPPVTIENKLVDSDRARILADAFKHLTAQQKLVLELAYYEGLSQTDIADRIQQPLGTVKSWTRMALTKLREEIDRSQIHFV